MENTSSNLETFDAALTFALVPDSRRQENAASLGGETRIEALLGLDPHPLLGLKPLQGLRASVSDIR